MLARATLLHPPGGELTLAEVSRWWTWDPLVAASLAIFGGAYLLGIRALWAHAGPGRGVRRWEVSAYAAGLASIFVALVSPLDGLSDVLFSAHMSQHEILMLLAAPLIVLGRPLVAYAWALPPRTRERLLRIVQAPAVARPWRVLTAPLVGLVLHGAVLWVWHVPALFESALDHEWLHAIQHFSFFVTAALFFWSLVHGRYGRIGYGVAVVYVFLTALHSSVLGAALSISPRLWYTWYEAPARARGVDAVQDQQLAGLIMWVPAGLVLMVVALALFAAWLGESERRARRNEA